MNETERLRWQVTTLTDELASSVALVRAMHAQRRRDNLNLPRRCTYCGYPCIGTACPAHSDLLELDEVLA
jgi:rubrerythrin